MDISKVKWTKVNLQYNRNKNQWQIIYSAKSIPLGEDENGVKRYKLVRKTVSVPIPLGYHRNYDPKTKQEINLPRDKKSHNDKRERELRIIEAEHQRDLTNGIYQINQILISRERICDWINSWMENKTMAKNTREGYGVLANHLRKVGNIHFISFDSSYINKFIKHLNDIRDVGKMGQSTIREYIDRLKFVMHEAERRKKIINVNEIFNEANDVPYGDTSIGNYFSEEQLKILAKSDCRYPILKRVFLFGCLTGLRFTEMMNLKWKDVNEKDGKFSVNVLSRKNKKSQVVPVSRTAMEYAGKRRGMDDKVFLALTYSDTNNKLSNWVRSAGLDIERTVTHDARRTCAYLVWTNTKDINTVAAFLNHKSIKESQRYLAQHFGDAFMEVDADIIMPNLSI